MSQSAEHHRHEATKLQHYWLEVDAMTKPMRVCELSEHPYRASDQQNGATS